MEDRPKTGFNVRPPMLVQLRSSIPLVLVALFFFKTKLFRVVMYRRHGVWSAAVSLSVVVFDIMRHYAPSIRLGVLVISMFGEPSASSHFHHRFHCG
jgi:hypothetical protein